MKETDSYLEKLDRYGPVLIKGLRLVELAALGGLDLTITQFFVLDALIQQRVFKMSVLARAMGVKLGNMTTIIDRMIKNGLVRRYRSDDDRRVVYVALTPKGEELATRARAERRKNFGALIRRIPEKQRISFIKTLEEMAQIFSAEDKVTRRTSS